MSAIDAFMASLAAEYEPQEGHPGGECELCFRKRNVRYSRRERLFVCPCCLEEGDRIRKLLEEQE